MMPFIGGPMKDMLVKVYLNGEVVHESNVRGKDRGRAVTNVLTNLYRGDVDTVKVETMGGKQEDDTEV